MLTSLVADWGCGGAGCPGICAHLLRLCWVGHKDIVLQSALAVSWQVVLGSQDLGAGNRQEVYFSHQGMTLNRWNALSQSGNPIGGSQDTRSAAHGRLGIMQPLQVAVVHQLCVRGDDAHRNHCLAIHLAYICST